MSLLDLLKNKPVRYNSVVEGWYKYIPEYNGLSNLGYYDNNETDKSIDRKPYEPIRMSLLGLVIDYKDKDEIKENVRLNNPYFTYHADNFWYSIWEPCVIKYRAVKEDMHDTLNRLNAEGEAFTEKWVAKIREVNRLMDVDEDTGIYDYEDNLNVKIPYEIEKEITNCYEDKEQKRDGWVTFVFMKDSTVHKWLLELRPELFK